MKRIVVCADGTWDTRDQVDKASGKRHPTNVTKLARAVLPVDRENVSQIVGYCEGVGTAGAFDKFTGGAFGAGIAQNIRELYRFIVYNYAEGDELYLFGFSRGAFTVRSLVGFMADLGLLEKDDDYFVPDLYAFYEKGVRRGSPEWNQAFQHIHDYRESPKVKCIGVWETVGALGAPGVLGKVFTPNRYKYHDVGLSDRIENAYHALAIDERRDPFLPSLWTKPQNWSGSLEQVWFAGVHNNIGGGYSPDGLANIALHWMIQKASSHGLAFDESYLRYFQPCFNSVLDDSMSAKYRLLGTGSRQVGLRRDQGEAIHQSVMSRMAWAEAHYAPQNLIRSLALDDNQPVRIVGEASTPC